MQYILTQQEYDNLLAKSEKPNKSLKEINIRLRTELQELKQMYNKLLVFGVSANNEKLKENKCKELS